MGMVLCCWHSIIHVVLSVFTRVIQFSPKTMVQRLPTELVEILGDWDNTALYSTPHLDLEIIDLVAI